MTLELHATPEEVMRAVEALQEFGQARQVPDKATLRPGAGAGGMRQQHRQPRVASVTRGRRSASPSNTRAARWSSSCATAARSLIPRRPP